MQIRCQNCHRPFALSTEVMRAALDTMAAQHLEHYFNVPCPHCHKLTRVPRTDLLHGIPDWKEPATGETTE